MASCSQEKKIKSKPSRTVNPYLLSEKLWLDVFLECDMESLLNMFKTCNYFKQLLNNRFWLAKCRHDGINVPSPAWDHLPKPWLPSDENEQGTPAKKVKIEEPKEPEMYDFDYKKIFEKNPLNRNLAYSLDADSTLETLFTDYRILFVHGGDGIFIEPRPQSRSQELQNDPRVKSCFATSFGLCCRYFEINLADHGLDANFLDHVRPKIIVRELCCCRDDCGAMYELRAQLLMEGEVATPDRLPRSKTIKKRWNQWEGGKVWETAELVFEDYPAGVRRIAIRTTGADSQFWAGHYGSKFTNTEILIAMPSIPKWMKIDDVVDRAT